ncbi:glycosyltransferase [Pseudotabrizicola sediminis]|uniref:Glycosyltransferase n=1 Tax=Pseudotabrizicola sediminis TaxID=2486418 RepID=A0ABY2KMF2_9RHOB|nr:WecB/TagA/CpsF family glycosyltransferase [Pseudotabrizicola sediminis]TGD43771.1 glycosyltransferase [Pseudotabrizicola sediminis]
MRFQFPDQIITVNIPDQTCLLAEVRARLKAGQGFTLATLNLDHLVKLRASASYRQVYAAQDLIVADGNPIVWLSHLARRPVALVPGSDLLRPLLQMAAEDAVPVAFYGSTPAVLAQAALNLNAEMPGLRVVWSGAPVMGFDPGGPEALAALTAMQATGARLCIISLSAPRQEAFAAFGRTMAPAIGFCGFGAGLDFVAGQQTRAPHWMRKLALEWLWRVISAPRRLIPRYLACIAILPGQVIAALRQRRGSASLVLDQPPPSAPQPVQMKPQRALRLGEAPHHDQQPPGPA